MLGIRHYQAFLLVCIAPNSHAGPDTFYILARSGREGHTVGLGAALGIHASCAVHTLAAVPGLSAIVMPSATAFTALKYIGAAYLVWIGLRILLRQRNTHAAEVGASAIRALFKPYHGKHRNIGQQ